jgi:hypothetical protein
MIYAFKKRKLFSEDARCGRSILNNTVDLHAQAADYHRNIAGIGIRQHLVNVAGIWLDRPDSDHLIGFGQKGQIPGKEPDSGRIWPERPDPGRQAGIRLSQIPTKLSGFWPLSRILAILAGIR